MTDTLDEIMARHDALVACGCNCCEGDYCAYADRQSRDTATTEDARTQGTAHQRKSLRYIFETVRSGRG